jgi:hypothetical protein
MKIGILKSKVESKLISSYIKGTFKKEIQNFKNIVLENKNLSRMFYLYDELNTNKGYTEDFANEFLNECLGSFKKINSKLKNSKQLESWVKNIVVENKYQNIDNFFYDDVTKLEEKINSKRNITETLKKKTTLKNEIINLPISTMVNVANKTILNHIESLNESDKNELFKFLSKNKTETEKEFNVLKENVISKLNLLSESSDKETNEKINQTITKVKQDKFNLVSFIQLKNLNESL